MRACEAPLRNFSVKQYPWSASSPPAGMVRVCVRVRVRTESRTTTNPPPTNTLTEPTKQPISNACYTRYIIKKVKNTYHNAQRAQHTHTDDT